MAEFSIDRFVDRYAERTSGMSASEVRALFAVASRPEVVSLAGGMPYVEALPVQDVLEVASEVVRDLGPTALQYGGGQGQLALRERAAMLMAEEGVDADPDDIVITTGAQQALDPLGKIFIDPGDTIAVEAPAYVGALTAFAAYQPRFLTIELDDEGMIVEQLERAIVRGERPTFVYTVPNFGNPLGSRCPDAAASSSWRCVARPGSPSSRTTRTGCFGSTGSRCRVFVPSILAT
jgi:DNA-binding transcriptional MocR family regulator